MYLYSEELNSYWYVMPWDIFMQGRYCPNWYTWVYEEIVALYNVYPYEVETRPENANELSLYDQQQASH